MLGPLLLLHLMAGLAVAAAVYLSNRASSRGERWFSVLSAVVFWPLYLPLLLTSPGREGQRSRATSEPPRPDEKAGLRFAQAAVRHF